LVSYSDGQPQLGFSDIRSASRLATKLQEPIPDPRRPTPEKKIQSWLIRSAIPTRGELVPLSQLLGGKFWFISDEPAINIATKDGSRIKIVSYLLLEKKMIKDGRNLLMWSLRVSGQETHSIKRWIFANYWNIPN
jgi:hypothetical protein